MHVLFFGAKNVDVGKLHRQINESPIEIQVEHQKNMCADMSYCFKHDKIIIDDSCKVTQKEIEDYNNHYNWILGNGVSSGSIKGKRFVYVVCHKGANCSKENCNIIKNFIGGL